MKHTDDKRRPYLSGNRQTGEEEKSENRDCISPGFVFLSVSQKSILKNGK